MNLATLQVEGNAGALEFLKKAIVLDIDAEWAKGDKRRNGHVHESSGFNATVADARNSPELISQVRSFLAQCTETKIDFASMGLSAELAIGFTVGDSEQFVTGVIFSPSELRVYGERGLALSITAYPTSDEANAT